MKRIIAKVGNVSIGGYNPIVVQTMCNTHTADIEASYRQCVELAGCGAGLIRLTVQGMAEVEAIREIHDRLRSNGIETPLVADIHFRSDVALAVAPFVEKVRVNPGNFHKDHTKACDEFKKLLGICRQHGTAIRIGINHGSLGERITSQHGDSPTGMAEAAMEWLHMCIENDFYNVVVSLKSSNVLIMVQAYRVLQKKMEDTGVIFPTHLGVTEAGNGDAARIKSAVGISTLLKEGIGDTIRISLTEDPKNEIPEGFLITRSVPECKGRVPEQAGRIAYDPWNVHMVEMSCRYGKSLLDREIDDIVIPSVSSSGVTFGQDEILSLRQEILQAARRRFFHPEYIACPGCGRTMFNLEDTFNRVKEATADLGDVRIAVMGCIVNGPGEMADADYGYVGEGRSLVSIYKGRTAIERHVPEEKAIDRLLEIIREDRRQ